MENKFDRQKAIGDLFEIPRLKKDWWVERAVELQRDVDIADQRTGPHDPPLPGYRLENAIIAARSDLVLIWSSINSANAQLRSIRRLLVAVVALLGYLAIKA